VTTYVRNRASAEAWLVVLTQGQIQPGGAGFPGGGYIGEACLAVPEGSQLVLLDRSPVDVRAAPVRVIHVGGTTDERVILWMDVSPDGIVGTGAGIPGWWPTGSGAC
jgi:hypothetical protein